MGLLNDIPADIAEGLEVGHAIVVKLDVELELAISLDRITLSRDNGVTTVELEHDTITMLTHALVTCDLLIRAGTQLKPCTDHDHGQHDHTHEH